MIARTLLLATALLAASARGRGRAEPLATDVIAAPVLRANVTVIGRHRADRRPHRQCRQPPAQIAIYRAPDLGTTGSLPVAQVLNTLRAHQVIGVDTRDLKEISVTRLARTHRGQGHRSSRSPARWSAATGSATPPISA